MDSTTRPNTLLLRAMRVYTAAFPTHHSSSYMLSKIMPTKTNYKRMSVHTTHIKDTSQTTTQNQNAKPKQIDVFIPSYKEAGTDTSEEAIKTTRASKRIAIKLLNANFDNCTSVKSIKGGMRVSLSQLLSYVQQQPSKSQVLIPSEPSRRKFRDIRVRN